MGFLGGGTLQQILKITSKEQTPNGKLQNRDTLKREKSFFNETKPIYLIDGAYLLDIMITKSDKLIFIFTIGVE